MIERQGAVSETEVLTPLCRGSLWRAVCSHDVINTSKGLEMYMCSVSLNEWQGICCVYLSPSLITGTQGLPLYAYKVVSVFYLRLGGEV